MIKETWIWFIVQAFIAMAGGAMLHGWEPWKYLKRKKWLEKETQQATLTSQQNSSE
jgi:hypothetical protein